MTVDLWVSPGPLHVAVPALRGPTGAQTRRSLADAGLLGDSRKTRSATFAAGPATRVAGTREQLATLTLDTAAASIEASRARDARSLRPSGGR
jgi:beta-lactam-binding protein with PASTA domain